VKKAVALVGMGRQENNMWLPSGRAERGLGTLLPCSTVHRYATLFAFLAAAGPGFLFSDLARLALY
jgi:hypothetical protein